MRIPQLQQANANEETFVARSVHTRQTNTTATAQKVDGLTTPT